MNDTQHDNPRYVNLDAAKEAVKALRDPMEQSRGSERAGWVDARNFALWTLDNLPAEQVMRHTIQHGDD